MDKYELMAFEMEIDQQRRLRNPDDPSQWLDDYEQITLNVIEGLRKLSRTYRPPFKPGDGKRSRVYHVR